MKKVVIMIVPVLVVIIVLLVIGKKSIYTDIIIDAPVDKVWEEYVGFPEYPRWNSFIRRVSGELKTGGSIQVTIQPKGHKPMNFNPTIIIYKEKSTIQWEGRLYIPGIFTGRHTFHLIRLDNDKTKFIQKEDFNGILVPFINLDSTLEGFREMNTLLKKRVEAR